MSALCLRRATWGAGQCRCPKRNGASAPQTVPGPAGLSRSGDRARSPGRWGDGSPDTETWAEHGSRRPRKPPALRSRQRPGRPLSCPHAPLSCPHAPLSCPHAGWLCAPGGIARPALAELELLSPWSLHCPRDTECHGSDGAEDRTSGSAVPTLAGRSAARRRGPLPGTGSLLTSLAAAPQGDDSPSGGPSRIPSLPGLAGPPRPTVHGRPRPAAAAPCPRVPQTSGFSRRSHVSRSHPLGPLWSNGSRLIPQDKALCGVGVHEAQDEGES